jgi:glycosyltransferase involved in cell wall biosynthesis
MKISVITPSLNSEKFLKYHLESVHLQQKGDFSVEQIIVDGNSKDRTVDIIEAFKQEYGANITLIQGKDRNMYDAINKGLRSMSGDVWTCLNTDDLYYPGIFELVTHEFINTPSIDVVYGYPDKVDENENFLHTLYLPEFDLEYLVLKGFCLTILQPASFLRKRVLDKVGYFDIDYKYASDYDYFIRVGATCNLKLVKKSFTKFRQHPESITCSKDTGSFQSAESLEISQIYMEKFGINSRSLFVDNLKFYCMQMNPKNSKYLLRRMHEISKSRSWRTYLKKELLGL